MDLIKRQDAIDAIDHYSGDVKTIPMGTMFKEGVKDGYCRIRSIIMSLPSAQQWVPVSERLPNIGEDILFSVADLYTAEGCLRDDGDYCQFRWNSIIPKDRVTTWMPLPEAYKAPALERDCEHCVHRKDKGCEKWNCEFERREEC